MNTAQNAQGSPRPDWLAKIEAYANRAADALIDAFGPLAKRLDDLETSIAARRARKRN